MKAIFIETTGFTASVFNYLKDKDLAALQLQLMTDPDSGDLMKGCGGLRKIRVGDSNRSKGKRSGARVIYLHVPIANCFFFLDIYSKNEKVDLTIDERKVLGSLARKLKEAAQRTIR